jgi:hypothetical protein
LAKTFTLEEAKTLLPVLGALLRRAREAALRAGGFEAEMQELSQRIFLSGGMHVDVPAAARRRAERDKAVLEARSTIEEMEEIGARVGDMEEGRLEFPYLLDGREVLLCWSLGEDEEIRQWREDEEDSPLRSVNDGLIRRDRDRLN